MTRADLPRYFASPATYDVMYDDVRGDVPFWIERARAANGPVLEVACGTGRVLARLVAEGIEADGLDADPDMLEATRAKLPPGARTRLVRADMRDFTMPRRYRMIFIPFSSFLHNLTCADQLRTLRTCREHLESGGALLVSIFTPNPSRFLGFDGTEKLVSEHGEGAARVRVWDANDCDPVAQTTHIRRRIERPNAVRPQAAEERAEFTVRWIWPAEMELLLHIAGFPRFAVEARTDIRGTFAPKDRLEVTDYMVWTAWKD